MLRKSHDQPITPCRRAHLKFVRLFENANQRLTAAYSNHKDVSDDLPHSHRDALRCFFFFLSDAEDEVGSTCLSGVSECSAFRISSPILSVTEDERRSSSALGSW